MKYVVLRIRSTQHLFIIPFHLIHSLEQTDVDTCKLRYLVCPTSPMVHTVDLYGDFNENRELIYGDKA